MQVGGYRRERLLKCIIYTYKKKITSYCTFLSIIIVVSIIIIKSNGFAFFLSENILSTEHISSKTI